MLGRLMRVWETKSENCWTFKESGLAGLRGNLVILNFREGRECQRLRHFLEMKLVCMAEIRGSKERMRMRRFSGRSSMVVGCVAGRLATGCSAIGGGVTGI